MKGRIIKIRENDFGQEYGFIRTIENEKDNGDYYFDNRYLSDGAMADFFEDDIVIFDPSTNWKDQRIAINVTLDMGAIEQLPADHETEQNTIETQQDERPKNNEPLSKQWYKLSSVPKQVQSVVDSDFSADEQVFIKKFWKIVQPTNAGHFKARENGIEYGYHLFGPTKNFSIQLGLEKVEFAMILCNRKVFQRRTLDEPFFYLTHSLFSSVRISGYFFVLVTRDDEIESRIQSLEEKGELPYSIIPFTYDELVNEPEESFERFVLGRFKSHLFERDFFSYSEPIKDRLFLFGGREAFAKGIADRCVSGNHSGVFGLRKSGKTSVLYMVKQELEHRNILFQSYHCAKFAPLDWFEALYKIVCDVYKQVGLQLSSQDYSKKNAIDGFFNDLNVASDKAGTTIVLLFDEIEQISPYTAFDPMWRNPTCFLMFWHTIISYCEENPGRLSIVVAGINPSINEEYFILASDDKSNPTSTAPRNPVYQKLSNENYLKPFVYEQTRRMVNELGKYMNLEFTDEVCYELQKDFGGHPFFTRQMCKLIVEHIKRKHLSESDYSRYIIERPLYNAVKETESFAEKENSWCDDILKELRICYPSEYDVLMRLANGDKNAKERVQKNTTIIPHLSGYGLIKLDPASKELEIPLDIVKNYLIARKEYKKPFSEMTVEEIDEEISKGMSKCERPLRDLITSVLSVSFPPAEAADFIRETKIFKDDNKQKDISSYSVQQLLDPRLVTLHFYALKDIICSTGPKFGDHFERFKFKLYPLTKAEVQSYLSNIYVARNAADHHYEVHNEGTLNNFRSSLDEILKVINQ